jgi:hypothetical protein
VSEGAYPAGRPNEAIPRLLSCPLGCAWLLQVRRGACAVEPRALSAAGVGLSLLTATSECGALSGRAARLSYLWLAPSLVPPLCVCVGTPSAVHTNVQQRRSRVFRTTRYSDVRIGRRVPLKQSKRGHPAARIVSTGLRVASASAARSMRCRTPSSFFRRSRIKSPHRHFGVRCGELASCRAVLSMACSFSCATSVCVCRHSLSSAHERSAEAQPGIPDCSLLRR